jgi:hypothetical protein
MPSREASLRNLQKARLTWRPPRPWRSGQETRVIRRLVWQWFTYGGTEKWSGRALARRLGVSHTYIQKLAREFTADPSRIIGQLAPSVRLPGRVGVSANGELLSLQARPPATFEQLQVAQQTTQSDRDRGGLRSAPLWKAVEFKIGDSVLRSVVPTRAGTRGPAELDGIGRDEPRWADGTLSSPAGGRLDPPIIRRNVPKESGRLAWLRRYRMPAE